ncbi:hypothetical protein BpHYR1_006724 [Brachionus plicatilis]|uniref:Uncharacterized protein n=1 Tax=Brachionus plicatilis TaxID=10195 RepID=A0A3M7RR78_BRAPC|nr:hypothetical protein BpHYR1_006724 [Brachionus plicatilis]
MPEDRKFQKSNLMHPKRFFCWPKKNNYNLPELTAIVKLGKLKIFVIIWLKQRSKKYFITRNKFEYQN